jgi:hypothetical protein
LYPSNDGNSTPARLVDLQTGELMAGAADDVFDYIFAPDAAAEAQHSVLASSEPQRARSAPLGKTTISGRSLSKPVVCSVFADIVQVGRSDLWTVAEDASERRTVGGKRGSVVGFSHRSRVNFMGKLARVRDVSDGFFLTLTFPDAVVGAFADPAEMGVWAKDAWAAFRHRFERAYPGAGGFWRMEFQDRKSGVFLGEYVPHFHVVVFGLRGVPLAALQDWQRAAWSEVIGVSEDRDAVEHGTNAWAINNRRHAMAYVSKYAAKETRDAFQAGRRWGQFGKLDLSPSVTVEMSLDQLIQFKRLQRGLLRSRGRGGRRFAGVLARLPASYGGSVLGLGDQSGGSRGQVPTVLRMLSAVGVETGKL